MGNERFMVPEALFYPSDIGLAQAGVAEVVTQAVNAVQMDLRGMLYSNVVLAGGCAALPGFRDRFEADLRPLVPAEEALVVAAAAATTTTTNTTTTATTTTTASERDGGEGKGSGNELSTGDLTTTCAAWRGGSVVGAGPDFARLAVTREEYKKDHAEFKQRYEDHAAVMRGRM